MSSPAETVNAVMSWLGGLFGIVLPQLPFAGVYSRLAGLFDLTVSEPLPSPGDPLPWTIPLAESWILPIPGIAVSIEAISIELRNARPVRRR
ncbi:hypothetical protein [Mangrovicella endophytica]|uniref:hypothetical protein n=1 Tax=Mangrovicella endophytica TaxID=2066697 RepID=UPI000C9DE6A1|nr:hypothetical protein [Mangrovicella endophytica]